MRIETINEILTEAISKASKIATKNPQTPILEYVHLEVVDDSTIRISGYNLDTYISQDVFVKVKDFTDKKLEIKVLEETDPKDMYLLDLSELKKKFK